MFDERNLECIITFPLKKKIHTRTVTGIGNVDQETQLAGIDIFQSRSFVLKCKLNGPNLWTVNYFHVV